MATQPSGCHAVSEGTASSYAALFIASAGALELGYWCPWWGCPHSMPNSSILPDLSNGPDSASSGEKSEPWSVLQDTHPAIGLLPTLMTPQILGKRASLPGNLESPQGAG